MTKRAKCNAHYCFTYVDIESFGGENDAAIFSHSHFYSAFENGNFPIPEPSNVCDYMIPYTLIADDIFPQKTWLMKPFPDRGVTLPQAVFNYRLSRAGRTIENVFGILFARWRIFRRSIKANVDTVDSIVQAKCLFA